jgi:Fe-S oxidoreductase
VNIDTAEVSILERQMLTIHNAKKTALPTKIVLNYLSSRSKLINGLSRWTVLQGGGMVQRYGARVMKQIWQKFSILAPFYAPSPPISAKTLYASFPKPRSLNHTLLISPEKKAAGTVFYFPGCGSERMHTDIALAAIFLLLNSKMRVVLPPPFLCCGFPARANAKIDHFNQLELRNTIIFSQIRSMLGYLSFDACIISCGTCREGLMRIDTANIFDATLFDVSAFVLNRDLNITLPEMCYYHQPCHDSLDGEGETLLHRIAPNGIISIPHCCSEAGTLALSRPDIAAAMLARKRSALMPLLPQSSQHHLLTNCPACLNGLGRQRLTPPKHLAVALADTIDNNNWRQTAMDRLSAAELVRF